MDNFAMWIGYIIIIGIPVIIVGAILYFLWLCMVCVISYMKVANHDSEFMGEQLRKRKFPKLRLLFLLLRGIHHMPIESDRVYHPSEKWVFYPGYWPKVYVNGVKI